MLVITAFFVLFSFHTVSFVEFFFLFVSFLKNYFVAYPQMLADPTLAFVFKNKILKI